MTASLDSVASSQSTPPRLWVFYGGETGPFCLLLGEDSTGVFYGGFLWHNPIRWRYHDAPPRLDLVFAHLDSTDYFVFKDNLARGHVLAFDSATNTASYSMDVVRPAIYFKGWVLVPSDRLEDWQVPYARRGCPPLERSGGA
jgi:hypothetical protein